MVADLLDISISSDDGTALLALQCLTNISVTSDCHGAFTRTVQSLYDLIDNSPQRRLNVLRVLINLSSNQEFVVYLLSAKVNPPQPPTSTITPSLQLTLPFSLPHCTFQSEPYQHL